MNDEALGLLRQLAKDVAAIKAAMVAQASASAAALGVSVGGSGGGGGAASASELDGEYGDPEIRKDPPRWQGESFAGRRYSETTPEYLDCLAEFNDWRAAKDDDANAKDGKGRPKSTWARKDARLARGWAARMRSGWKPKAGANGAPPVKDEDYDQGGYGDEIPF